MGTRSFPVYTHLPSGLRPSGLCLYIRQSTLAHDIKTHDMSCCPRSRRVTPVSILTGRKKTQFSHLRSCASLMKQDDFFCGYALQLQHSTFQLWTKSLHALPRYATSKIGLVSLFFFFLFFFLLSHTYKNCYKTWTPYPIALKFCTQKGSIKAHLGTNIGWNTINKQRVMNDYSRKITPICCHAYRVNRVWKESENRWVYRLNIEPLTFCGLKEIELKTRKIQRKNQQCVTITQSRLVIKKRLLATPTR